MDGSLNFDGQKYISAKVAAENFGYTSDYVGQLCRGKKVTARQIGRIWYVLESDLVEHKKNTHPGSVLSESNPKKTKSSNKINKNNSATLEKSISKNTEKATSNIFLPGLPNNDSNDIEDKFLVLDNTNKNIAKKEGLSRSSEILDKSPKYEYEETELFPNLVKKIDIPGLKYTALESLENSINKPKIKSKFEKLTVSLTLAALFLALFGVTTFGGANLQGLSKLPFEGARAELAILYGPYFNDLKNDYANSKKYLSNPEWQFDQLVAASFFSANPLNSAFGWLKDTAYKVARPWLEENAPVFVVEEKEEDNQKDGSLFPPTVPDIFDQAPQTIVQSKTVYVPASDRDYLDLRIEEKFAELKNYFLVNPLAPNVNRYYVTRQNDVIASALQGSSSSSGSSGSSGSSTFLDLTDTQSSFTANRIVHTNGSGTALTDTAGFVFDGSNLGIGTTTPYAPLSVVGQIVGAYFTGTTTATSTFGGNLAINGTGTTTSNGGFNISAGCFALNGTCISGGGGSGASSTLLADSNTWSGSNNFTQKLALSTTTPFAKLSIESQAGEAAFVVGSSTATSLIVNSLGRVGVGTANPTTLFHVAGGGLFSTTSNNTYITVRTDVAGNGVAGLALVGGNVGNASFALRIQGNNSNELVFVSTDGNERARLSQTGNFSAGGAPNIGGSAISANGGLAVGASYYTLAAPTNGAIIQGITAVGTSTAYYNLTVASTTGPQLSLSAGVGIAQWVQRNAGGNFYLSTTTVDGLSTTSISALEIAGSGFGTTTVRGLNISAQATTTSNVGINLSGGCFAIGGTCLSNSSASSTLLADSNSFSGVNRFAGLVNLASVALNSIISTDASGNIIATSTPTFGYFNATSTSATSTISGGLAIETSGLVYDYSTNNVGINTATPSEKLQISNGNILLSNQYRLRGLTSGGTNAGIIGIDGSDYTEIFSPLSGVKIKSANSIDLITVLNGGNVGIGTTTPVYRLTVASSTALTDGAGVAQWVQRNAGGNFYLSTTTVDGLSTTTTSALTILGSNGYVGIGTTTPTEALQVKGDIVFGLGGGGYLGDFQGTLAGTNAYFGANVKNVGGTPTQIVTNFATWLTRAGANADDYAIYRIAPGGAWDGNFPAFKINGAGNVGIGEYTPGSRLSVSGGATIGTAYDTLGAPSNGLLVEGASGFGTTTPTYTHQLTISSSTAPQLSLSAGVGIAQWVQRNAGGNFYLSTTTVAGTATTSTSALSILGSSGNVGIGTNNPGYKLEISGATTNVSDPIFRVTNNYSNTWVNGFEMFAPNLTANQQLYMAIGKSATNYNRASIGYNHVADGSNQNYLGFGLHGADNLLTIKGSGAVGISTTTPYYNLTVASTTGAQLSLSAGAGVAQWVQRNAGGNLYFSTTTVDGLSTTSISALEIAGSGFGTTTVRGLNISAQATTTSNVGINLSGGCFAINGSCVSGGGSGASSTLLADSNTWSGNNNFTQKLALSTTTPFAKLSIESQAGEAAFVVGSSTATSLIVDSQGNVGIGTTAPGGPLQIGTVAKISSAGTLFFSDLSGNNILNSTALSFSNNATIGSGGNTHIRLGNNGNVGISTSTTVYYNLTVASTTGAQLSLSAGAGIAQWVQRNAGGNFYLATTTVAGTSTTTLAAFSVLGSSGNVGIATTSPTAKLSLQATISTDDLFRVSSTTGASLFKVNNYGALVQTLSSTTAISIQDSSGNAVFNVDTTQSTGAGLDITAAGGQTANLFNIYQSDGTTNYLAVGPSGNFGIGTGTPSHLFTVATSTTTKEPVFDIYYNSSGATSTVGFFVSTTTGSAAGVGLGLPSALANYMIVGNGKVQAGMAIVNGGFCVDNDGWCTASTTGRISSVTSTTGGSDVAEMYNSSEALEPGDVVAITEPRNFVKVANGAAGDIALGIVSTEPGVLLGLQPDANDTKGLVQDVETDGETISTTTIDARTINKFPIALAGRVPVKVSIENGAINPGDYLVLSSTTPGVAVKAVVAGQIVGQALEGYSDSAEGKILVFVKNTYYPGPVQVANVATSTFDQTADLSESEGLGATILKFFDELGVKVMNGVAYMKNLFTEKLTVGTAENPSGITLYDEDTGDPYCLKIKNGGMVSIAGECLGTVEVVQPITDNDNNNSTTTATTTPTTTDSVSDNGNQNSTTTATTTATSTITNSSNDNIQTTTATPEAVTNNSNSTTTEATITNNTETVTNNDNSNGSTEVVVETPSP